MAVAALSTSALALAAGPAPAPATPGAAQAPEAFAKLVERARPDDTPSRDGARPEGSAEGETETAVGGDEAAATTPEGEAKDPAGVGAPADLLARINAMVEAAGRIGITVPAPVSAPAPTPDAVMTAAAELAAPVAIATTPAPVPAPTLATAAVLPAIRTTPPVAEVSAQPVAPVASGLPVQQPAPTAVAAGETRILPDAAAALPGGEASPIATAPLEAAPIVRPAVLERGSDIAQLLASLRSAFGPLDGKGAPAPVPATAAPAASTAPQPAVGAAPVVATPAPGEALPQAAMIATAEAPATATATAAPVAVAVEPSVEEIAPQTISIAPQAPDTPAAPIEATAAPKAEAPVATSRPDLPATATDQPAPLADAIPVPAVDTPADRGEAAATPVAATAEAAAPLPTPAPATPSPTVSAVEDSVAPAAAQLDQSITRELDLVRDTQWLDRLARDISQAATRDGQIRFQLNPEHLGALTVEIANSAAGTAIRMTADTDQARAIIADAQPRLLAEVRAQGLRIAESHVDLNQQGSGGSSSAQAQHQQQNRQPSEDSKPFVRTQTVSRDDAVDSAPADDGELYA